MTGITEYVPTFRSDIQMSTVVPALREESVLVLKCGERKRDRLPPYPPTPVSELGVEGRVYSVVGTEQWSEIFF